MTQEIYDNLTAGTIVGEYAGSEKNVDDWRLLEKVEKGWRMEVGMMKDYGWLSLGHQKVVGLDVLKHKRRKGSDYRGIA